MKDPLVEYLEEVRRKRSPSTYAAYRSVLEGFFSEFSALDFRAEDVNGFLEQRDSWDNATKNYFLTVLGGFVDYLKANMPIPNPAADPEGFYRYSLRVQELNRVKRIPSYSVKREVERMSLSLDELRALLKACEEDYPARFFIWCYAYFGLRRNELLRITVGDVDFGAGRLNIRASITKSMPRYFYFNDETKRVLKAALDYYGVKRGRVFPVSPGTPNSLLKPYQKYVEPKLTTHTFRHNSTPGCVKACGTTGC